ncbi:MAG: hypothetical protein Fur0014_07700 [Rubrivivax sp.]
MTARVPATTLALCAALALTALPGAALAQAKTGALGGGAGAGPIMTRDELRACLKSQAELKTRVADYEAQKAAAEKEKADIVAATQALAEEKAKLSAAASKVKDENTRAANLAQRVDEWNERWQAFEKAQKAGPMADRERKRLLDEQKALQREQDELKAAAAGGGGEAGVASAFNQKVEALNARTVAYNNRNKELVKLGEDLQQERDLWAGECGNRRFREEDEIAIKQGK